MKQPRFCRPPAPGWGCPYPGPLEDAGAGDALEMFLIHTPGDQLAIRDDNRFMQLLTHLCAAVEQQGLIEATGDGFRFWRGSW